MLSKYFKREERKNKSHETQKIKKPMGSARQNIQQTKQCPLLCGFEAGKILVSKKAHFSNKNQIQSAPLHR